MELIEARATASAFYNRIAHTFKREMHLNRTAHFHGKMKHRMIRYWLCCGMLCLSWSAGAVQHRTLDIQVLGLTKKPQKNVELVLQNARNRLNHPLTQLEVLHFYDQAPRMIQNALAPYGFFRSHVHAQLTNTHRGWLAQFSIQPGPPLRIASVQIQIQGTGKTDPAFQQLLSRQLIKAGDVLHTEQYETFKTELYNLATQRGYFNATLKRSNIFIDLKKYHANIIIVYDTGPRFRFGETTFSLSPFHQRFLKRFLQYKAGEYYDVKKVEETQSGLVASQFFNQALIEPILKKAKNNKVPMLISLLPRQAKEYVVGVGYGTDTGVRGTVGVTLRRLNGWGHHFQTLLRGSQDNGNLSVKYFIPGKNPGRDLLGIGGSASSIRQPTGNGKSFQLGPDYTITLGRWKNTFGLSYLNETYNIIRLPHTSTQLVYPNAAFRYLYLDNAAQTNNGLHFRVQVAGANQSLLSETNFFQIITSLKTLYTFEKTHTRFLFRTKVGHTEINNLAQLPLSLQLFSGVPLACAVMVTTPWVPVAIYLKEA